MTDDAARQRGHIPVYDDVIVGLELAILGVLLLAVLTATFLNILDRNFKLGLWEYAIIEKMIYSCVYFLGLFGGVVAARRAKHITVDAVSHFLPVRVRGGLNAALQLIGAFAVGLLAQAAYHWVQGIEPERTILEGRLEWWLSERLWRWPIVIAFGWMAMHFLVNSGRFLLDTLKPPRAPEEAA